MGDSRSGRVLGQLHHWLGSKATVADDGKLLERFVHQRDEDAFAELVSRHGPLVFGLCRRLLGNAQDAEDVFQATFFVLARKAAMIRKPESLSCWLHGVAYRLARKAKSEANKRRIRERQAIPFVDNTDSDLSWREVCGLLDEELQHLPEKQRLPLVLCYLEGLTQDEASRRLGWPRGTLKRRLEAGRERLRLRLTKRGLSLGISLFTAALTQSASRGAVPLILRSATVRAAMRFVTEETTAVAATPAALLAKGALQSMLTTKLRLGAMAILLLGCVVTAAGLAIPQAAPEKQPENKAEAPAPARPAEDKQARKDRYGDPLPPGAIARLGTMRLRHQQSVNSVVFTRDSKTAIASSISGDIVFWDVATGCEARRIQAGGPGKMLHTLAISADGKILASGGNVPGARSEICLWDVETGKLLSRGTLEANQIRQLLFTPDDKTLVLSDSSNVIRLWDIARKKVAHELKGHPGPIQSMALSPDGKTLASASGDANIRLWDVAAGKEKLDFAAGGGVSGLAFSPDGKTLSAIGLYPGFALFDANTGKKLRKVDRVGQLLGLVYAHDGKTLIGMSSHLLQVFDAASGKDLRRFEAPRRMINWLTLSPDGKTLATFGNGRHTLELWDVASGKLLHPAPGHRHYITSLVFSADGRQVFSAAGLWDIPLQVWDARTGERRYELGDNPNGVDELALSPDGKLLAACGYNDNTIRLWDPAGRKEVRVFKGDMKSVQSVAWSTDGKTLASAGRRDLQSGDLRIWDAATGKQRWEAALDIVWWPAVALSPDNKIVAVSGFQMGGIRLWSVETGKELRRITTPQQIVYTLAFSPDGSALASGGLSGTIHLWEPATGRLLRQWNTKTEWISHLAFAHDGRTLVAGHNDGSVHLWEAATGKERACFQGHRSGVRAVAISRDGRYLASGGEDTTILVWDAAAGASSDVALSAEQLRSLWDDLNAGDAGRAYRAMWRMALAPERALPFLTEHLRPIASLDAPRRKQFDRLLADLEDDAFAVREKAEKELAKMGPWIAPALRKVLEGKPSLEARRRIETVLEKITAVGSAERLQTLRALEAIEHMNTPQARRLLEALANGAPHAWLTEEARAICKRLAEQSAKR